MPIPTYIINLKSRTERKKHILDQFTGRDEFNCTIVEAFEDAQGAVGLWKTLVFVLKNLATTDDELILVCEDDHEFTSEYSRESLLDNIEIARRRNADLLLGGASSVHSIFKVTKSIIWTENYTGNQFVIIFNKFFKTIINAEFSIQDAADHKFSALTSNIFIIYPFISIQKEFGYSDVTSENNIVGRVSELFKKSSYAIEYLLSGEEFYRKISHSKKKVDVSLFHGIRMPVFVWRTDVTCDVRKEFKDRSEFEIIEIKTVSESDLFFDISAELKNILKKSMKNDDDFVIISDENHMFTNYYEKNFLWENIISAHYQGCDILLGGLSDGFNHALLVDKNRYWINNFNESNFIVIFYKFYNSIINYEFENNLSIYSNLSKMTCNTMVMYPFISKKKNSSSSGNGAYHNPTDGESVEKLYSPLNRLATIKYCLSKFAKGI